MSPTPSELAAGDGPPWRLMQRVLAIRDVIPAAWKDALAVTRVQLLWPHQLLSWASAPGGRPRKGVIRSAISTQSR